MGRMYFSVSQYVRGIPACSGLLVGARCLGGLFYNYSILFYSVASSSLRSLVPGLVVPTWPCLRASDVDAPGRLAHTARS